MGFGLLDPPYRHDTIQEMLLLLEHHVASDGKIICEHERELELPEELGVWRKKKRIRTAALQ